MVLGFLSVRRSIDLLFLFGRINYDALFDLITIFIVIFLAALVVNVADKFRSIKFVIYGVTLVTILANGFAVISNFNPLIWKTKSIREMFEMGIGLTILRNPERFAYIPLLWGFLSWVFAREVITRIKYKYE